MTPGIQVDPSQVQSITVDPSQVQAMPGERSAYAPAQPQTVGHLVTSAGESGLAMLKSLWDWTRPGMGIAARTLSGQPPDVADVEAAHKAALGLLQAHYDQAKQALESGQKRQYSEAFGHMVAAITPMVGPAAAHFADRLSGRPPTFDRYGNVVAQGQEPDPTGAIGEAIPQVAAAVAVPVAVRAVRGAPAATGGAEAAAAEAAPAAGAGIVASRLNPVQQAAVDYLRANDVPLNVGTITGNKFIKGAQALIQNQPLGAGVAAQAARATERGLTRVAGELAEEAHPAAATPESAGAAVTEALEQKIGGLKLREDEAYGQAWRAMDDPAYAEEVAVKTVQRPISDDTGRPTGKTESVAVMAKVQMPVDVRAVKQLLGPVFDQMQWMPASDQAASAGYQAAKRILSGPDFIPAAAAEQGLSGLKTMARVANVNLRNTAQGMAAGIIPDLQDAVNDAVAKTGSDALAALQDGRASHATKMEVAEVADKLREEPVQAFNQATWRDDTGIGFLRKLGDQAPDALPQIGRAFLEKLFGQATQEGGFSRAQTIAKQWETLGPQTKQLLYPNLGLRGSLDNFFLGAKMVSENPNPSGTAVVAQLIPGGYMMIHNPVLGTGYLLGGYAAAKLLFSPRGVALLTEGLRPAANAGAAGLAAAQILRIAGDEDVRVIPGLKNAPEASNIEPGATNAGPANNGPSQLANRAGEATPQPLRAGAAASSQTSVPVPGASRNYQARYAVRELSDIRTSHNGLSFAPNEKYELVNDRDYTRPENQSKIFNGSTAAQFDPRYLITDNPDAGNGPPIIDTQGNTMGGNGRAMILQRVYANNPTGAQAYRGLLVEKAAAFGLDPAEIQAMKQPVLVREIADADLAAPRAKQTAVTDFNAKGTAALRPAEQAISDSRRVSLRTLEDIGARLDDKGPDATLADVLGTSGGADVLQHMIDDGAIGRDEAAAYVSKGQLTPAGKARISQALVGRFFRDPAQMDRMAPAVRNKLERIAAPLAKAEEQPEWSLTPHVQSAFDLIEEAAAHGSKNLDDVVGQGSLFGAQKYSPQAIELAKQLQGASPTALLQAVRAYAQDARFAREGSGLFGEPPTPAQAFEAAFPVHR
jgi:hypothetical protein